MLKFVILIRDCVTASEERRETLRRMRLFHFDLFFAEQSHLDMFRSDSLLVLDIFLYIYLINAQVIK